MSQPRVTIELNPREQRLYDRLRERVVEPAPNARTGWRDLLLLLPDLTILLVRRSSFEIRKMAQDLLETVANTTFTAGDLTTRLTLSIGLVELTSHIKDPAQAFNLAQKAARKAREQGGNSLCGTSPRPC